MNRWTAEEVEILAVHTYWPALEAELSGKRYVKSDLLETGEAWLSGRSHHTVKDRCYRISQVLWEEGLPWVRGWKPPELVGQRPNSPGVDQVIRELALPYLRQRITGMRSAA
jgi:hypothetical protein